MSGLKEGLTGVPKDELPPPQTKTTSEPLPVSEEELKGLAPTKRKPR